jgi:hypothetical protein
MENIDERRQLILAIKAAFFRVNSEESPIFCSICSQKIHI